MSDLIFGSGVVLRQMISGTYYEIGCAETIEFEFENEIIFKTDVNAGAFRKKRKRISDCRGRISGITKSGNSDNVLSVFYELEDGVAGTVSTYQFLFTDQSGTQRAVTMDAVVSRVRIGGNATDFSDFDVEIEGTGGFQMDEIDVPGGSASQVDSDTWTISGGLNYIEDTRLLNATIIEVCLEGTEYEETSGTPSGREYKFTANVAGKGRVEFDTNVVINGQKVFVIWVY